MYLRISSMFGETCINNCLTFFVYNLQMNCLKADDFRHIALYFKLSYHKLHLEICLANRRVIGFFVQYFVAL